MIGGAYTPPPAPRKVRCPACVDTGLVDRTTGLRGTFTVPYSKLHGVAKACPFCQWGAWWQGWFEEAGEWGRYES